MSPEQAARFEHAFARTAERHERIWMFVVVVLSALLAVAALFLAMLDAGVVVRGAGFARTPGAIAGFVPGRVVRTGPASLTVDVEGHLWAWTPRVLHVPQGTVVTFVVTSRDVLHGFAVQGTTINMTAVPGVVGTVTYRFRRAGVFHVICNEYCGIEHQAMVGRIVVDPRPATP